MLRLDKFNFFYSIISIISPRIKPIRKGFTSSEVHLEPLSSCTLAKIIPLNPISHGPQIQTFDQVDCEESYNRGSNQEHNDAQLGHDPNAGQNNISPSPGCDDLRMEIQALRSPLLESEEIIGNLTKENRDLKAKLGQNSSNSNWPSGKDKFKAKPKDPSPDDAPDRRQGGRPGRPLFRREPIKPEDADDIQEYGLTPDD
ncbi:MAG: DUF6444 domain-containing protein [Deltaproteobacteria bacterium]|jgi:hypothetical protein|nr:DUF6444 domain-containing protein [Deltaproteobacteria bacterium]